MRIRGEEREEQKDERKHVETTQRRGRNLESRMWREKK